MCRKLSLQIRIYYVTIEAMQLLDCCSSIGDNCMVDAHDRASKQLPHHVLQNTFIYATSVRNLTSITSFTQKLPRECFMMTENDAASEEAD